MVGLRSNGIPDQSIATSLPHNGDPTGLCKTLGDRGVIFGLEYTNDTLSNVRGGLRTGTINQGKLQGILTVDFDKLTGWDGLSFETRELTGKKGETRRLVKIRAAKR